MTRSSIFIAVVLLVLCNVILIQCSSPCDFIAGSNKYLLSKALPSTGGPFEAKSDNDRYIVQICNNLKGTQNCPGKQSMAIKRQASGSDCITLSDTVTQGSIRTSMLNPTDPKGGLKITYDNTKVEGYTNKAEIHVLCDPTASTAQGFRFVQENQMPSAATSVFVFEYTSKCACPNLCDNTPNPPSPGGPTGRKCGALGCVYGWGGLILTLSAVALILYFVIGFVICKFKLQKEGIEMIPNVRFWIDIPFLLKDGVMLIVDLFRKITNKGETYQSL